MPATPLTDNQQGFAQSRLLFLVYSIYRLGISAILLILFFAPSGLGAQAPALYLFTACSYFAINLALTWLFLHDWQPDSNTRLAIVLSDILLLQLAASASGVVESGLGVIMVVSVAAGSIFVRPDLVMILPAFATIALLISVAINIIEGHADRSDLVGSGWLGIAFFVASTTVRLLTIQIQRSESLAEREAAQAKKLEHLNSLIIDRMQTGIVVVDNQGTLLLSNEAAARLLALGDNNASSRLVDHNRTIAEEFARWQHSGHKPDYEAPTLVPVPGGPTIKLSFVALAEQPDAEYLVFVEDLSKLTQHAQQLKLASLGQLTASIAHEIRNPVGAISHAAQLLGTNSTFSDDDQRLARIINEQTRRCSNIIDSILSVSRGHPTRDTQFELTPWLHRFVDEYAIGKQAEIHIDSDDSLAIRFDPDQLNQVLANLLDNGLRYSEAHSGEQKIVLAARNGSDGNALLDVIDFGSGVPEADRGHLFEPFFTTETSGSGLGLYICQSLCQANQAQLSYVSSAAAVSQQYPGAASHCFRIHFAHPSRRALVGGPFDHLQEVG